jgi:hypothetical protein
VKRLYAEYHGRGEATVYEKPGLFRRTRERVAVLTHLPRGGLRWRWLDGTDCSATASRALTDAYRSSIVEQQRPPPN